MALGSTGQFIDCTEPSLTFFIRLFFSTHSLALFVVFFLKVHCHERALYFKTTFFPPRTPLPPGRIDRTKSLRSIPQGLVYLFSERCFSASQDFFVLYIPLLHMVTTLESLDLGSSLPNCFLHILQLLSDTFNSVKVYESNPSNVHFSLSKGEQFNTPMEKILLAPFPAKIAALIENWQHLLLSIPFKKVFQRFLVNKMRLIFSSCRQTLLANFAVIFPYHRSSSEVNTRYIHEAPATAKPFLPPLPTADSRMLKSVPSIPSAFLSRSNVEC